MAIPKKDNWVSLIQKDIAPEKLGDYTQKYELITQFIPQSSRVNGISVHALYFGSIRVICFDLHKDGFVHVYRENGSLMSLIDSYAKLKAYLGEIAKKVLELSNGIHGLF